MRNMPEVVMRIVEPLPRYGSDLDFWKASRKCVGFRSFSYSINRESSAACSAARCNSWTVKRSVNLRIVGAHFY